MRIAALFLCCVSVALCVAQARAQTGNAQQDQALEKSLQALAVGFAGHLSVYATDLHSGRFVAMDADRPVPTASVIKLGILYEALQQIRSGEASFGDKLTLTKANQVPGSGVLLFFDTPLELTLHDVLTMMIAESDNTATNLAIDKIGIERVDKQLQVLGLKNTWLYKKIMLPATAPMPADQPTFGLGKTTAREMASLMQRFVTCDLGSAPAHEAVPAQPLCDAALGMLEKQFFRDALPRYLDGNGMRIVNKTGALEHVRNDVGVVWTSHGPIVLSIFTDANQDTRWTADNSAEVLTAKLSQSIVDAWR